jgi:hypothetical protein
LKVVRLEQSLEPDERFVTMLAGFNVQRANTPKKVGKGN